MYKLVDIVHVGGINWRRKVVLVLVKQAHKWYWYCSTQLRCFRSPEGRRAKVLFGLSIEKSNIDRSRSVAKLVAWLRN